MKIIGLTGGIGAGKSTVCLVFRALGIPIYDADGRAKWLLAHDPDLRREVAAHFGADTYRPDGTLDRARLAAAVFGHEERRQLLNRLVHPRVGADTRAWVQAQAGTAPYVVKEAALMIESGAHHGLDRLVVVTAPLELRLGRVLARDPQRSEREVRAIMAAQLPEEEKLKLADHVIHNDGQQLLVPQVLALHRAWTKLGPKP
jgi:dephospho-CoA kinase